MLKMMAADNDDAYNLSPAFILETVAAAKSFIGSKGNVTLTSKSPTKGPDLDVKIAAFLAWPSERVKRALSQLSAIEEGDLSKRAVESLPTARKIRNGSALFSIFVTDWVERAEKLTR